MFIFGLSETEGWFYTPTFRVYQKVNQDVYCYVSKYIGFYVLQLYERGTTGYCTLEARSKTDIESLFRLGEEWLNKYQQFDLEEVIKEPYHIGQINHREKCWI